MDSTPITVAEVLYAIGRTPRLSLCADFIPVQASESFPLCDAL